MKNSDSQDVVLSSNDELIVRDANGRDRERHSLQRGAMLLVKDGDKVEIGDIVARWDPHTNPIIAEVSGKVVLTDIVFTGVDDDENERITKEMNKPAKERDGSVTEVADQFVFADTRERANVITQTDELTGRRTFKVLDAQSLRGSAQMMKPAVVIEDEEGNPVKIPGTDLDRYPLPPESIIELRNGQNVQSGDILARVHQESSKARDITGGMPRVIELFEARKPKEPEILAQASGVVSFGKETKSKHRFMITGEDGTSTSVLIPKTRQIIVFEGQTVERGEVIADGSPLASDILEYRGVEELADYIVNEVQDVYQLQGVKINDKHIEVIVRQMLRKVKVTEVGDSNYLLGEQAEKSRLLDENDQLIAQGKNPAKFDPVLLGITKASLTTESFISAASFQETTRVLTDASVNGKIDTLRGLKENVIVGRLIPAGTGLAFHDERKRNRLESLQKDQELEGLLNTADDESADPETPADTAATIPADIKSPDEPQSVVTAE